MSMSRAARSLVTRARAGDQNAMGMIAQVRETAKKGGFHARVAFGMLEEEVHSRPIFGQEAATPPPHPRVIRALVMPEHFYPGLRHAWNRKGGFTAMIVALANGPKLTAGRIDRMVQGVPNDAPGRAGRKALAVARSIQAVRLGFPLAQFSKMVAWELGE